MQTYMVFVKNKQTGEEFVVPHNGAANAHQAVMAEVAQTYPAQSFQIHTAYALKELQDAMESVQRWPGVASKPQKEAKRPFSALRPVATAIPHQGPQASIFANGSMLSQKAAATKAAAQQVVEETAPQLSPAEVVAVQQAEQRNQGQSVVALLKAMREQH